MSGQTILAALKNISLTYSAGNTAISKLTLNLFDSEVVGIVGANGSGKTSLLKLLAGYMPCTEGSIILGDMPVGNYNERMLNSYTTFVEQNPESQLTGPTVEDELARSCRMLGMRGNDIKNSVTRVLNEMKMTSAREWFLDEISAGERRRVALGLALLGTPKLLLLDEPLCDLDDASVTTVRAFIKRYKEKGVSILISSRSLDGIISLCDRIAVLGSDGAMLLLKPTREIAENIELHKKAGIASPLIPKLMSELKKAGVIKYDNCPLSIAEAKNLICGTINKMEP